METGRAILAFDCLMSGLFFGSGFWAITEIVFLLMTGV